MNVDLDRYVIFDIEIVPLSNEKLIEKGLMTYLLEKQIKGWYMVPFFSMVVAVGFKEHGKEPEIFIIDRDKEDEEELIKKYWKYLDSRNVDVVVTYNGLKFDIPYMMLKSIIYSIPPTRIIEHAYTVEKMMSKKFSSSLMHIDCLQNLFNFSDLGSGSFSWLSLYAVARGLNIHVKDDVSYGSEVNKFYLEKNMDAIREHNKMDLEVLDNIYNTLITYFNDYIELAGEELPTEKQINLLNKQVNALTDEEKEKLNENRLSKEEASRIIDRILHT